MCKREKEKENIKEVSKKDNEIWNFQQWLGIRDWTTWYGVFFYEKQTNMKLTVMFNRLWAEFTKVNIDNLVYFL